MIKPKNYVSLDSQRQEISEAMRLRDCLAKTYRTVEGRSWAGRTVLNHCEIVGNVARELIARMPAWLQNSLFPKGSELVAGAHDIGKVSPTFQEKIYRGTDGYQKNSKCGLENIDPQEEAGWGGHAGVSQLTAVTLKFGKFIPEILGQHHGYSPTLGEKCSGDMRFGGAPWQSRREELVNELQYSLKCDWPKIENLLQARVLAGLTSVSDWIGSGEFFENPTADWQPNIELALDNAGFIRPKFQKDLSFKEIFTQFDAHDAQKKLFENCIQPGIYILEAPMGLGKTEAALYAAYLTMLADKATGFYFALPTQLTSDKIHVRVNEFLAKILAPDCYHRKALLLHGNAWLHDTEMGEEGKPGGSWFNSSKRGILAPFAVGTIDQALMAVMNVKHGFVRTFGLAGKVVILDEVHSYDAYTGTLLDELVTALRALHCTVIILSATLTKERRAVFLKQTPASNHYPLISASPTSSEGSVLHELAVAPLRDAEVTIHHCQRDSEAIEEALRCAEQGQQVLWIENTVDEAQEKFTLLAARAREIAVDVGLLHSRFIKVDRAANEEKWVKLYGKEGGNDRALQGRILIGTQVLEQSLDIDADFLVTRVCPTDMLLQRIGRLWRHPNTLRPIEAGRRVWLLAPSLTDAVTKAEAFGKTAYVYSPYVLCRSLEVWGSLTTVAIPSQIRELLEATYQERKETGKLAQYKADLQKKREKLQRFALVGLSSGINTQPEHIASTRYSEQESVEVLLIKSCQYSTDCSGTDIALLNGERLFLPRNCKAQERKKWRILSAKLMQNVVSVPEHLAPEAVNKNNLRWLKDYFYLGDKDYSESMLRIAIVQDSDALITLTLGGVASSTYDLNYNPALGYHAVKKQSNRK